MKNRTEESDKFPETISSNVAWNHDETGEVYKYFSKVKQKYPVYAMKWSDGIFGGYRFSCENGDFSTEEGVRGIGFKSVIAFDVEGNGLVFIQD